MAGYHTSEVYGITDAKIARLTADSTGGSATYASSIDLPGITEMSLDFEYTVSRQRGDNTTKSVRTSFDGCTGSVEHAWISLDALAVLQGSTVTDSGAGAAEVATDRLLGTNTPNYFKLEATALSSEVAGDIHFIVWKAVVTSLSVGMTGDEFANVSFDFEAVQRNADSYLVDRILNETAVAIS